MKKTKNKGITLVALVVTIIILLILAGISIATLTENGLFEKARLAKQKSDNAQNEEKLTLGDYQNEISEYVSGSNREENFESGLIENADLKISNITQNGFIVSVTSTVNNESDILDYHIYVEKISNSEKKAFTGLNNMIEVNTLESNVRYRVYSIVCDINGQFKKSNSLEITTLDGPLITMDSSFGSIYTISSGGGTIDKIKQYLFDRNLDNGGQYKGVMFAYGAGAEFTVSKNIKIFAYGHKYVDSGGSSGQNIVFQKYNGTSYENFETCTTDASGNRYELITLQPGKYKFITQGNYVNFDEWEIEVQK